MKNSLRQLAAIVITSFAIMFSAQAIAASPSFGDEKTSWHGFDRYDFLMDETDRSIKPHKAAADEGNAVRKRVSGHLRCVVVAPK